MKKLLLSSLALSLALVTIQVQGQTTDKENKSGNNTVQQGKKKKGLKLRKLEGDAVSELAKSHFYADFGDVPDVKWERKDVFDVATFTKDGRKITAYYDYDAELVGTVEDKNFTDLPPKAQQYIQNKYKDYTIGSAILFTDNQANDADMMLYELQFNEGDSYFVELKKDNKNIVLRVDKDGNVYFFKELK